MGPDSMLNCVCTKWKTPLANTFEDSEQEPELDLHYLTVLFSYGLHVDI